MENSKKISHIEFLSREYNTSHLSYEREMEFFNAVKTGDLKNAMRLFKPVGGEQFGMLSLDKMRNLKYHLVITVAFITRYCIEGGMPMEEAYNLSDIYIRAIDKCIKEEQLRQLHSELVEDFTQRMQLIRKKSLYPKQILLCLDYIYDNLNNPISLKDLAKITDLSPSYLSRFFAKEVGMPVSKYITSRRIEAAENMLKYSEYSCLEISDYLSFSSESHFIQVFKKLTGYTPKKYRAKFFRQRKTE